MTEQQFLKNMIDFQKTTFNNYFNAMVLLQEQTERVSKSLINQMTWLPDEGRRAGDQWIAACKQGRRNLKALVDENFTKAEAFFAGEADNQQTRNTKAGGQKASAAQKTK